MQENFVMYYMSQFSRQPLFMKISKEISPTADEDQEPGFTYLTNHTHVLVALNANAELRVRDLATAIGITERAIQRILADLEAVGVLEREKLGRRNSYKIRRQARLRHPLEGHCTVGGLLDWVENSAKRNG
jgi:DNA-binding transcriptional ArsR family regulator